MKHHDPSREAGVVVHVLTTSNKYIIVKLVSKKYRNLTIIFS